MATYTIYLGTTLIATIEGTECAYSAYRKACELAEIVGNTASLVWAETGEVVASSDDEGEDEGCLSEEDLNEAVLEMGFDPYEGCYTFDC